MSALGAAFAAGGLDLLGGIAAGGYNAKMAREQMDFQERMRDTQYQAAAKDLEKAGLNRVLALGSPAAAPSGASASIEAPKVGSSATNAYNASSLMKEQVNLMKEQALTQKEQQVLARDQQDKTRAEAEKIRAETPNVSIQGDYMRTQIDALRAQIPGWEMIPAEKKAHIDNMVAQLPKIAAETRMANANASEAEFKKMLYEKFEPLMRSILDIALPSKGGSASVVGNYVEKSRSLFSDFIERTVNFFNQSSLEGHITRELRKER